MDRRDVEKYKDLGAEIVNLRNFGSILAALESGLGSPDSPIREGCLDILWDLIEADALSGKALLDMGDRMADNLARGIETAESDRLFLRTFSCLILALIISRDEISHRSGRSSFLTGATYGVWYGKAMA